MFIYIKIKLTCCVGIPGWKRICRHSWPHWPPWKTWTSGTPWSCRRKGSGCKCPAQIYWNLIIHINIVINSTLTADVMLLYFRERKAQLVHLVVMASKARWGFQVLLDLSVFQERMVTKSGISSHLLIIKTLLSKISGYLCLKPCDLSSVRVKLESMGIRAQREPRESK